VYLEHWPSGQRSEKAASLDLVVAPDGSPSWRRIWPLEPEGDNYAKYAPWIRGDGAVLLDALDWDGPR
jgi:hypothetical protein